MLRELAGHGVLIAIHSGLEEISLWRMRASGRRRRTVNVNASLGSSYFPGGQQIIGSTTVRAWRFCISLREPKHSSFAVLEHIHLFSPSNRLTDRDEHARHCVCQEAGCHEGSSRFSREYLLTRQSLYGLVIQSDTGNAREVHQLGKAGAEARIAAKFSPVLRDVGAGKHAPCSRDNQLLLLVDSVAPHPIHGRGSRAVSGCTASIT